MIRFENISKLYGDSEVLRGISFEINPGEFAVLIGPSGCGKTTTLKIINRLIEPDDGAVYIDGQDTSQSDRVALRRSIGYVIQQIGLFPNMTVAQNICVVPKLLKYDKKRCAELVNDLLSLVNMSEYADKYPSELSGGQQQRVGVLRALAASPPIVLMDEPFGALDPMTRAVLQVEIKNLQKKLGKTIVFVTHDMDEALILADRIIFMDKGQIVQIDSPERMLADPKTDLVRSFLGKRVQDSQIQLTAADFMRTNVISVLSDKPVRECTELMAMRHVDTLLVRDASGTYLGKLTINNIMKNRGHGSLVSDLPLELGCISHADEDAKECFEKLLNTGENYVTVLDDDNKIVGIVTNTSMAEAMATALWGNGS